MVAGVTRWLPGGGGLGGRVAASVGGTCGKSGCQNFSFNWTFDAAEVPVESCWIKIFCADYLYNFILYNFGSLASYLLILSNLYDIV